MPSLRMLQIHQSQPIDHLIIITLNDWTIDFQVIQWTVLSNAWPRPWQQLLMKNVFDTRTQFPEWISFLFHSFSIVSITYSSIYAKHCLVHSRIIHTSFYCIHLSWLSLLPNTLYLTVVLYCFSFLSFCKSFLKLLHTSQNLLASKATMTDSQHFSSSHVFCSWMSLLS